MADVVRTLTFVGVIASLVVVFVASTYQNRFRLSEEHQKKVAITPATTVSRFHIHFVAGSFHHSVVHIAFNLTIFTIGYWLATQRFHPVTTVATSYAISMVSVFLLHIFLVLPLAKLGLPYAVRSLDVPLVGFSVIAYATLGAGIHELPRAGQIATALAVVLFEVAAGVVVTAPFVSVYHIVGFAIGFYIRWLLIHPFSA